MCVERLKNKKTSFLLLLSMHFGKLEDINPVTPWKTLDIGHFTVTGLSSVKLFQSSAFNFLPRA